MNGTAALRGSRRWLQIAVTRCPDVVDGAISRAIGLRQDETIEWLSPLESEDFIEYRDQSFLERLGINLRHRQLSDFWPVGGPVWDGLARTSTGRSLLIEAKANVPEFDTNPTGATGQVDPDRVECHFPRHNNLEIDIVSRTAPLGSGFFNKP